MQFLTTNSFKACLHDSLRRSTLTFPTIRVRKHQHVYDCGDVADAVYFIESGHVKLLMLSLEGKECLLDIRTASDTFGELRFAESGPRCETAIAMEDTKLKCLPPSKFFRHLNENSLVEGFILYLVARVADQQHVIANLITVDSEHRLAETLLSLAHKLGQADPFSTRIEHKITHEELAGMVGTTRPRITAFMLDFRARGLIEITPEHFLIIKQEKLADYLRKRHPEQSRISRRPQILSELSNIEQTQRS